jgi:hypothetical protein
LPIAITARSHIFLTIDIRNQGWQFMGTVNINGKRFVGNNITIRNGKVVIDGKAQDVVLDSDVEARLVEGDFESAECVASVICGEVQVDVAAGGWVPGENVGGSIRAGVSMSARGRAGSTVHAVAVAIASAESGLRKATKQ